MKKSDIPTERFTKDVAGMPVFAAKVPMAVYIDEESQENAVPADDEWCALALGCRRQLKTPYVSVGRSRTDLALPHPKGVLKPDHGETRWAVYRFENPPSARRLVVAADTGNLDGVGVVVELQPPRSSLRPEQKREQNKRFREQQIEPDGRGRTNGKKGHDALTMMGVRDLSGQRWRKR